MAYGIYPYPIEPNDEPFLEILHLEANPSSVKLLGAKEVEQQRLVKPVGQWLIWYAVNLSLGSCQSEKEIVILEAVEEAKDYYQDTIGMTYQGPTSIAPGEDGHAFSFTRAEAQDFKNRFESEWPSPAPVSVPRQ